MEEYYDLYFEDNGILKNVCEIGKDARIQNAVAEGKIHIPLIFLSKKDIKKWVKDYFEIKELPNFAFTILKTYHR